MLAAVHSSNWFFSKLRCFCCATNTKVEVRIQGEDHALTSERKGSTLVRQGHIELIKFPSSVRCKIFLR